MNLIVGFLAVVVAIPLFIVTTVVTLPWFIFTVAVEWWQERKE